MNGGHVAFPSDNDRSIDLYAIINGKKYDFAIRTAADDAAMLFIIPAEYEKRVVVGVVARPWPASSELIRIPTEIIRAHGHRKGSYLELVVNRTGQALSVEGEPIGRILSFENLDGVFERRARD
jgi:hypothetical protein